MILICDNCSGGLLERKSHIHKMEHARPKHGKIGIMYGEEKVLRRHWEGSLKDKQV